MPQCVIACSSVICRIHNNAKKRLHVTFSDKTVRNIDLEGKSKEFVKNEIKKHAEKDDEDEDLKSYEYVDLYWPIPHLSVSNLSSCTYECKSSMEEHFTICNTEHNEKYIRQLRHIVNRQLDHFCNHLYIILSFILMLLLFVTK